MKKINFFILSIILLIMVATVNGANDKIKIDKNIKDFFNNAKPSKLKTAKINAFIELNENTSKFLKKNKDVKIIHEYKNADSLFIELDATTFEALQTNNNVIGIYEDMIAYPTIRDSAIQIEADEVWNTQISGVNITGVDQSVCVLGYGINYSKVALGAGYGSGYTVIGGYDFIHNDPDPYPDNQSESHETGVGDVVSGQGSLGYTDYLGMAYGGYLVSAKVANATESLSSTALTGFEWCVDNSETYNISAIVYSWGTNSVIYTPSECQQISVYNAWRNEIIAANNKNITFVNSGGNTAGAGINKTGTGVHFPGCIDVSLTVGGVSDSDVVDYYTQAGPGLDLLAPDQVTVQYGTGYAAVMGSSFAAPHVAGAIAVLQQYSMESKGYSAPQDRIFQIFNNSAIQLYDEWADEYYGRINMSGMISEFTSESYPLYNNFGFSTTNFSVLSLGELDSVSGAILETEWARVDFDENINVDFEDLDSNIIFANNSVLINTTVLSGLNVSANITIKNLTYESNNHYHILKDDVNCTTCTKISSNPIKFTVTGFSEYTTEPTEFTSTNKFILKNKLVLYSGGIIRI